MPGPVALARELGVPIVPMAIWGPQRILTAHRPVDLRRGRPVSLLVGPPLYVDPGTDLHRGTELLGATVQDLLDDLQARPVHQPRPGEPAPWHPAHLGGCAPTAEAARAEESVPRSAVPPTWGPLDLPRAG